MEEDEQEQFSPACGGRELGERVQYLLKPILKSSPSGVLPSQCAVQSSSQRSCPGYRETLRCSKLEQIPII